MKWLVAHLAVLPAALPWRELAPMLLLLALASLLAGCEQPNPKRSVLCWNSETSQLRPCVTLLPVN